MTTKEMKRNTKTEMEMETETETETETKMEMETEMETETEEAVRVYDSPALRTRKRKAAMSPALFEIGEKKTRKGGGAKKK